MPYLLLVSFYVFVLLYVVFVKTDKYALVVLKFACLSVSVFFFGFRGFIGWDWYNYFEVYRDIPRLGSSGLIKYFSNTLMEPAFIFYCSFIKVFSNSFHFLTLVNCIIDLIFLNWFLGRYLPQKLYFFAFLLFFLFGGFYLETDLLRNSRSIFLFLFSIQYIETRKFYPYYFYNIIGILFHLSSVIYLFVYRILNLKINKYIFVLIFLVGNILFLWRVSYIVPLITFATGLIGGKFSYLANVYFIEDVESYGLSIGFIERNIMALLVIFYFQKIKDFNKNNNIFINSYLVYFILFFYFSEVGILSTRFGLLFYYSYWILIPTIFELIKSKILKAIFIFGIAAYAFLKMHGMTKGDNYRYENVLFFKSDYNVSRDRFEIFLSKGDDEKD
jgi:hypothetical protein